MLTSHRPRKGCGSIVLSMSVYLCACVCLFVREDRPISGTTHEISTNFSTHVAHMAVARSSSGRVTKTQGEGAALGFVRAIQKHRQSSLQLSLQKGSFNRQ